MKGEEIQPRRKLLQEGNVQGLVEKRWQKPVWKAEISSTTRKNPCESHTFCMEDIEQNVINVSTDNKARMNI